HSPFSLLLNNVRMHQKEQQTGILLTNLGSPYSTNTSDVKKYLDEFLMDKWVIDSPYLFRYLLMHCLVVPSRAPESAKAYKKIWLPEGSPLIVFAEKLKEKVQQRTSSPVALSMRYGKPSTEEAFKNLLHKAPQLKEVVVLPLYPQYTITSFESSVATVK